MANAHIAIVGAGPRGVSCLERLCASAIKFLKGDQKLTIHVIDPYPIGPGKVWRPDQPRVLLMNTVASQITVFTDETVRCKGPIEPGPSLHAWAAGESWLHLGPNDYPTRFVHGFYLEWAYGEICRRASMGDATVEIVEHHTTAIRLDTGIDDGGRQELALSNNATIPNLSAVILAQGHVTRRPGISERRFFNHVASYPTLQPKLQYFPPGNPADVDLHAIAPGENVLLRGLGLVFFDNMILLSSGRGGRFEPTNNGLAYHPSGKEPKLYACSNRGIPHHARGDNEKGAFGRHKPRFLTQDVIDDFNQQALAGKPPGFKEKVWPLVEKEVKAVYYKALFEKHKAESHKTFWEGFENFMVDGQKYKADRQWFKANSEKFIDELRPNYRNAADRNAADPNEADPNEADPNEVINLKALGIKDEKLVWSWGRLERPQGNHNFATTFEWNTWLIKYLRRDVEDAREGNVRGPLKAALDVLRDIRNEVRLIVDHHGVNGVSYRDDIVQDFTPLNAFLSIGPPRRRIEEMVALMEAGILEVLGPDPVVELDNGPDVAVERVTWHAKSRRIADGGVRVRNIIDAYVPPPSLTETEDPLLRYMLEKGQCRPHTMNDVRTGAVDIGRSPFRIIDNQNAQHTRRFAVGVPTEGVHWVTTAGARPCLSSVNLTDNDAVAQAALEQVANDLNQGLQRAVVG